MSSNSAGGMSLRQPCRRLVLCRYTHPRGGQLDILDGLPWSGSGGSVDQFGLVVAVDGLGQGSRSFDRLIGADGAAFRAESFIVGVVVWGVCGVVLRGV